MKEYFRRTFLQFEDLPVREISSENVSFSSSSKRRMLTDATMALTPDKAKQSVQNLQFPSDFLWGAATAAYQIEGGLDHCNWSMWEQQGTKLDGTPTVEHNERAGRACDGWERFNQDLESMKKLGLQMYRFSVEWSRIEPQEGVFDEAALDRYKSWCQRLKQAGIEPMITLHHFTEPKWFVDKGGWEKRTNLQYFAKFVDRVTDELAPHCRYWTTINELNGYAICGWLAGVHPPGKVNDLLTMLRVIRHLLVAHTMATKAIRAASATKMETPIICLALNHVLFLTANSKPPPSLSILAWIAWILDWLISHVVALFLNYVYNFVFLDAIFAKRHAGRFPIFPIPFHAAAVLAGWSRDIRNLKGSADWIGVNHYYRSFVEFGMAPKSSGGPSESSLPRQASPTDMFIALPFGLEIRATAISNFEKNEMGWDLTPSSMSRLLQMLWDRYHQPIIITESGTADTTDKKRVRYIAAILLAIHEMINKSSETKVDIRGYLVWTLMDNFEWAEGYRPKFGILSCNFETMERTERKDTCDLLRSVFCK
jgi:beta-glucosidase